MKGKSSVLCTVFLVILSFPQCDEQLPPRSDPQNLLQARVEVYYGGAVDTLYGPFQNAIWLDVIVRNNYEETLDGIVQYDGALDVVWHGDRDYHKTVALNATNLVEPRVYKYDRATRRLTMDPGDELRFSYIWEFVDDQGIDLVKKFDMRHDNYCAQIRFVAGLIRSYHAIVTLPRFFSPESIAVQAHLKLFQELATSYSKPISYAFEYETFQKGKCQKLPNPP